MKNVSVIIRNKNEERWIGHAIQSALNFLDQPEIIVIDNMSSDDSLDIIRSFRHDPALEEQKKRYSSVVVEKIDDYTPGKALNTGVNLAKHNTVLILSAHSVIKSLDCDRIQGLLDCYSCVFGKQNPVYRGRKITPRYLWSHFRDTEIIDMWSDLENRHFLHNAACFYNKQAVLDIPFDEEIGGKEDRIWASSCVRAGFHYMYSPAFEVDHHYTQAGNTWKGVG